MSPATSRSARVAVLVAVQWSCLAASFLAVWLLGVRAWGAWLPAGALFFGAALYVWQFAPDPALPDRAEIKTLSARSGAVHGGLAGVTGASFAASGAWLPEATTAQALGILVCVAVAVAMVCTILTLTGLDAGRTGASRES